MTLFWSVPERKPNGCYLKFVESSDSKAQIENWILNGVYSLDLWEDFLPMPWLHKCIYSTETTSGVYNHIMQIF